ncbi:MAG: DUF2486 family protein [Clostridia bacterium]|nr:DUF2486 family protein [Clostridia bacterium]
MSKLMRCFALLLALCVSLSAFALAEDAVTEEPVTEETVVEEPVAEEPAADETALEQDALAEENTEGETPEAEETPEPDENEILAYVNGAPVPRSEFTQAYDYYVSMIASNYGLDVSSDAELQSLVRAWAVMAVEQNAVVFQKATEWGLDQLTEEEEAQLVTENDESWESAIEQYISYNGLLGENATDEDKAAARLDALAYYEANGYTRESTLAGARQNLILERVEAEVTKDVVVSDEDIKAHFDALVAQDEQNIGNNAQTYEMMTVYYGQEAYFIPEGYRAVTHVLLKVDSALLNEYQTLKDAYDAQQAPAEETAEENAEAPAEESAEAPAEESAEAPAETEVPAEPVTWEQVEAARQAVLDSVKTQEVLDAFYMNPTPETFAALVEQYGEDPGMTSEPNKSMGYYVHKDSIVWDPAFTAGAMSIAEVGQISEPVIGSYGVHIIYYLRDVPAGAVELTDDMAAGFYEELLPEAESEVFSAAMAEWVDAAELTFTEAGAAYKDSYEAYQAEYGSSSEQAEETAETADAE